MSRTNEPLVVRAAGVDGPSEIVPTGHPAAEIVKAARAWAANLFVIVSHGPAGIRRAVLGRVAEAVMRHSPCLAIVTRVEE